MLNYIVTGPSHTARWWQRIVWKQFPQPNAMKHIYYEAAGAIFSKKLSQFIADHVSEVDVVYMLIPDFRFGNNILGQYENIPELFMDGFISPHKEHISIDSDRVLFRHALKVLDFYSKTYGDKVKFIFWCLNYREAKNIETDKYIIDGEYKHPIWNIDYLISRYPKNSIDIMPIRERIKEFTMDEQGHPSLKGFIFLHHLFRLNDSTKALEILDSNYNEVIDIIFSEDKCRYISSLSSLKKLSGSLSFHAREKKVEVGNESWLFLANDSNRVINQHKGEVLLNEYQLKNIKKVWVNRSDLCNRNDIHMVFVVIPNKHSIYHKHLPGLNAPVESRPVSQLKTLMKEIDANFKYPIKQLNKRAFLGEMLFDKIDTHWNSLGAYRVYEYLSEELAKYINLKNLLNENNIEFHKVSGSGDLGSKMTPVWYDERIRLKIIDPQSCEVFDNGVKNRGRMRVFKNKNNSLPVAMIYGDSFYEFLAPILSELFSKTIFIHSSFIDYDIIEKIKPDLLLCETVERFLINHPNDDYEIHGVMFNIFSKLSKDKCSTEKIVNDLLLIKKANYFVSFEINITLFFAFLVIEDFDNAAVVVEELLLDLPGHRILNDLKNVVLLKSGADISVELTSSHEILHFLSFISFSKEEIEDYIVRNPSNVFGYVLSLQYCKDNNLQAKFSKLECTIKRKNIRSFYLGYILANYFFSRKKYEEALHYFDQFHACCRSHGTLLDSGVSLYYLARFDEAIKSFESALEMEGNNYKIYFYLGLAFMQVRKFTSSDKMFQLAAMLNDSDESILIQNAVLYKKMGRLNESKTMLQKSLKINPKNDGALKEYGAILFDKNEYRLSKEILQKVSVKDLRTQHILRSIGRV